LKRELENQENDEEIVKKGLIFGMRELIDLEEEKSNILLDKESS